MKNFEYGNGSISAIESNDSIMCFLTVLKYFQKKKGYIYKRLKLLIVVTFTYCTYLMLYFYCKKEEENRKEKTGKKETGKKPGKILGHGDGSVSASESDDFC